VAGVEELISKYNKQYGPGTAGIDMVLPNTTRCPSGLFAFDLATGGGIPLNRVTILFGTESSGKTNVSLCLIREYQIRWPDRVCVFVDVEGTLTTDWAQSLGVDTSRLVVIRPDYSEQLVDMVDDLLQAEDIGLIVVDSIAAMAVQQDIDGSAEKMVVGTNALATNRFCRKIGQRLKLAMKGECSMPTIVLINQLRYKVGVVFGNPETLPGGEAQKFTGSLRIRLHGKNVVDKKVNEVMPVRKLVKGVIQKWKHTIVATHFEFEHVMIPHGGIECGYANDWPTIKQYSQQWGLLEKADGGGYTFLGTHYDKLGQVQEAVTQDSKLRDSLLEMLLDSLIDNENNKD
jgi:recombination protein RecA